jgi:hypothetical protein
MQCVIKKHDGLLNFKPFFSSSFYKAPRVAFIIIAENISARLDIQNFNREKKTIKSLSLPTKPYEKNEMCFKNLAEH